MQPRRYLAVVRLGALLRLRDAGLVVLMTLAPLVLMPFMIPACKTMLASEGYAAAAGAEQAVPGMATLFSFLSVQVIVQSFFREHAWGTWPRLRASAATAADVVLGKVTVAYVVQALQLLAVLALGSALFNYRPAGDPAAIIVVALLFAAVLAAFGVALSLWARTEGTALSLANLIGMLAAGLGGTLCTVASFPEWAQPLAKLSPAYWALDAVRAVSLDGAGFGDIAPQLAALGVFLAVLTALAMVRCFLGIDGVKTE
ncbi:ABC transporter permease [Collinsella sp. An2]|uniref:ABC transporter permease n=1 Tax=Collinsella sp. An2 TaxID=1965585 RepID=UPI000B3AF443|nr:ABC transporter permease [Collinsella sp. An2]OUP08419.1 ABC transporter [Collinsella sp. An2]